MAFEELLEDAGGFGRYQKILSFVFLLTAMATAGLSYWTQIFILVLPPYTCKVPDTNLSTSVIGRDSCQLFLSTDNGTESNTSSHAIECNSGWDYDYSDLFPTMASEHDWVCSESWRSYVTHTAFWVGSVVGFCAAGLISDRLGRRTALIILELLSAISNIISIFMPDHVTFSVLRFFTGMTVLTSSTLAFLVTIEYTGVRQRTMIGMLQGVGWTMTAAAAPWIVHYVRNWRKMLVVCAVPNIVMVIMLWWVPESASWLLTRGKKDKAVEVLNRIASVNKKKLDKNHFKNIIDSKVTSEIKATSSSEIISSIIEVWNAKRLRKNLALLLILWLLVSLCYNGNTLETINLNVNLYIAFSVGATVELAANLLFWLAAEKLGRRWANFVCNFLGTAFAISILAVPKDQPVVEFACAMVLRLAYACAYDVTLQYGTELLPTSIRGRGVAIQLMIGDIGNCIAPSIVYLSVFNPHYPLLIFGVVSVGSAIIAVLLPETANKPLPQTIEDGSKFGIGQSFCLCPFRDKNRTDNDKEMTVWADKKNSTVSTIQSTENTYKC